jgi:glyoxylase-like metal-dependent hydrolase (beta-lactamase superfamily II)
MRRVLAKLFRGEIKMKRFVALPVMLGMIMVASLSFAQQAPTRAITKIAGDLYRFQNNFHYSVFLVTPDGIIVTDPIDKDAATWLKAELQKRFAKPIKYLIYSHDHRDHIAGGEIFADEAIVVAHANARAAIIGEQRPTAVPEVTLPDDHPGWQKR